MNGKRADKLRMQVLTGMEYVPNEQETKKEIFRYPEFRKIYRAAKKIFHLKRNRQSPKFKPTARQLRLSSIK